MPNEQPPTLPDFSKNDQPGSTTGAINPPDLTKGLKPRTRAISDAVQAKNIITNMEFANRERNMKNARIQARCNSERPYGENELKSDGLDWKSNVTTRPLPLLIDKVAPRFGQAIDGMKYLTNSALPDEVDGSAKKTDAFRKEITCVTRARPEWKNLIADLAQENALFGYAALAWLDEFHFFPKFFRQDQFFIPTGTKQSPSNAQIVVLKETFLVHELFDLIADKDAAATRGWNIDSTVKVINAAMPEKRRSLSPFPERIYQDLIRENNVGSSFENGPLVVTVWHLLATEITGKVSHYIFSEADFTELFSSEDQFENMLEATAFFAFEQANGTMHGSKGIGRQLYALAGVLDRSRNEVIDRLMLSGKVIVQADEKLLRRFKMSLVGNMILIGQGYNIVERRFDAAVEPFLELDKFLTSLLDTMAGATTPKFLEGERVTKAQVDLYASREEEGRDVILGRFLTQFARMMTTMQRRMCNPATADKDAKEMQARLLKVMTREELKQISETPVAETVEDFTEQDRQKVTLVAQEAAGNPLYNQKELQRRKITAQISEEFAEAVLLPDEDPTVAAEQTRLQQLELLLIAGQGTEVPVSPRDNHLIHLTILMPAMEAVAQQAATDPHSDEILHAMLSHGEAHLQAALAAGGDKKQLAPIADTLNKLRANIDKLHALSQAQAQVNAPPAPGAEVPGLPAQTPAPATV